MQETSHGNMGGPFILSEGDLGAGSTRKIGESAQRPPPPAKSQITKPTGLTLRQELAARFIELTRPQAECLPTEPHYQDILIRGLVRFGFKLADAILADGKEEA